MTLGAASQAAEHATDRPEACAAPERPDWLARHDGDETYNWARVAWDVAASEPGAWFDAKLADAVIADWPKWATLTLDRFAGVPFKLAPWQEIVVRLLVGWMIPIEELDPATHTPRTYHIRLFRKLVIWVPRKNGKSEFMAALAWLFFAIDGVMQGEGYVFARKEDQAKIIFNRMASMVAGNADLKANILTYNKSFYVKRLVAKFELLTGAEEGLHGKAPTVIVGDEIHEWKSTVIADTLRQGSGNRMEPIEIYGSTGGRKSGGNSTGEQVYDECKRIVDGVVRDPTTLVVIYAANDDDDPADEAVWRRANPNLGLSPTLHFMRTEFAKTQGNPRALAHFKCYHLGIWAEEAVRWLPLSKWDACAAAKEGWRKYPETLKGRRCFAAFDISSTRDITALLLVFPPTEDDPKWRVLPWFFMPAANVADRVANGAPLQRFLDLGAMETTAGDYVDQNAVAMRLLEACRDYDVQQIGYDPWNATKLVTDLCAGDLIFPGAPKIDVEKFIEMRQGVPTLGEPSKAFERLVFAGLFDHGGHPVLRWMAGNAVVHFDRNLNFVPAKDRSSEKIDGVVAAVMAVGLAGAASEEESVFEKLARSRAAAAA